MSEPPDSPQLARFRPVMRQEWRELLFLHWRVDRALLAHRLPSPLELDTYQGEAWVGLVPFAVRRVTADRCRSLPLVPGFGEINVRTYVRLPSGEPGVWFFSLDADSAFAVLAARLVYRLPYFAASVELEQDGRTRFFAAERWFRPLRSRITWKVAGGPPQPAEPGSLEEFLIERYALYTGVGGVLYRARVAHRPYPLVPAELRWLRDELVRAAGITVTGPPIVHYATGVDVEISAPERLGRTARAGAKVEAATAPAEPSTVP